MSQPEVFGDSAQDPYRSPLTNIEQLVELFHRSARPQSEAMIGIEYEMFGQIAGVRRPLPFEGPVSIAKLFEALIEHWRHQENNLVAIKEGDHIVGISGSRAVIALEPGGQLEIAARPQRNLDDAVSVFSQLVKEIQATAKSLGIDLFALGIHPTARREDMAQVKKARYQIMRDDMQAKHGLGLDMMTRSCAIQINLDYQDENDLVQKARLGAALAPFYALLCSSAAFVDGKPSRYALARAHVWRETDPSRTGIPSVIFAPNFGYEAWIEMVLDVPMYFIRRGQTYNDARGMSFRHFMTQGLLGHRAQVRDFLDHMSTVYTEIRLKPILELRSADSLPLPYANALTTLTWALFYDDNARSQAQAIFCDATHQEISDLKNEVIDNGREARFRDEPVFSVAERLMEIAKCAFAQDSNKVALLTPLEKLIEKNITCSEWILTHFTPLDDNKLQLLIKSFAPDGDPLASGTTT